MRRSLLLPLLVVLLVGGRPGTAAAQSGGAPNTVRVGRSGPGTDRSPVSGSPRSAVRSRARLGVWVGHSIGVGSVLGTIRKGRVVLLGLRYSHLLLPISRPADRSGAGPRLRYTLDLIPVTHLRVPAEALPDRVYRAGTDQASGLSTQGLGAYPVGLRLTFRPRRRLRPFLAGQSGALYFSEDIPDSRGRQLNFAVGIGAGLQVSLSGRTTLTIGYRYHHLSNGFRGSINPGLDANMLYLGVGADL